MLSVGVGFKAFVSFPVKALYLRNTCRNSGKVRVMLDVPSGYHLWCFEGRMQVTGFACFSSISPRPGPDSFTSLGLTELQKLATFCAANLGEIIVSCLLNARVCKGMSCVSKGTELLRLHFRGFLTLQS